MFLNGVEVINTKLGNISLDFEKNMQPMTDRPPVGAKGQLPRLHLTPSDCGQKKSDGSLHPKSVNPALLKPHHDIPPTPPPQTDPQPLEFFPQRIG